MKSYNNQVLSDTTGLSVVGAKITVYQAGTKLLATLFAANDPDGEALTNPFKTGDKGLFQFFAVDGKYDINVSYGARAGQTLFDVELVDILGYAQRLEAVENGEPGAMGSLRADLLAPEGAKAVRGRRSAPNAVALPVADILNSYEVTPEQFGAVGGGLVDDAPAIQRALDYIKTVATLVPGQTRPGTLLLTPGKRYKCGSGLTIDRAYHNVYGYATLDFSSWTGTYIHVAGSYTEFGTTNGYGQRGCFEGQIVIVGSGAGNASIGILYETLLTGGTTRIRNVGISITKCGIAVQIGERGYNQEFISCEMFDCGVIFDWLPDTADADERVTVFGGTFYNSNLFLRHKRAAGCFYVFGASVDYCGKLTEQVNGKQQWFGVHTEASNWGDCPIDVSGSGSFLMNGGWFLMQENFGALTYFVRVGAGASVKFVNVITNNTNNVLTPNATTPTTWATGAGRFEVQGLEPAFEFGGFPARQHSGYSVLSDGEFERSISEDTRWLREDTQPITDRYTGTNLKLSRVTANPYDGTGCLRADKQFGGFSNAAFILMAIPVRYGDKVTAGFRVRTAPDRVGTDRRLVVRGGFAKLDGFGAGNVPNIARFAPPGEQTVTPLSTGYSLVTPYNGLSQIIAPSWATHYLIDVNAFQAAEASFLFDGLWADRG
jgi:hypothetical protein